MLNLGRPACTVAKSRITAIFTSLLSRSTFETMSTSPSKKPKLFENSEEGWHVAASLEAKNTINPIRAILDQMTTKPNPDFKTILLSLGKHSIAQRRVNALLFAKKPRPLSMKINYLFISN